MAEGAVEEDPLEKVISQLKLKADTFDRLISEIQPTPSLYLTCYVCLITNMWLKLMAQLFEAQRADCRNHSDRSERAVEHLRRLTDRVHDLALRRAKIRKKTICDFCLKKFDHRGYCVLAIRRSKEKLPPQLAPIEEDDTASRLFEILSKFAAEVMNGEITKDETEEAWLSNLQANFAMGVRAFRPDQCQNLRLNPDPATAFDMSKVGEDLPPSVSADQTLVNEREDNQERIATASKKTIKSGTTFEQLFSPFKAFKAMWISFYESVKHSIFHTHAAKSSKNLDKKRNVMNDLGSEDVIIAVNTIRHHLKIVVDAVIIPYNTPIDQERKLSSFFIGKDVHMMIAIDMISNFQSVCQPCLFASAWDDIVREWLNSDLKPSLVSRSKEGRSVSLLLVLEFAMKATILGDLLRFAFLELYGSDFCYTCSRINGKPMFLKQKISHPERFVRDFEHLILQSRFAK